jgi:hypothetical protein
MLIGSISNILNLVQTQINSHLKFNGINFKSFFDILVENTLKNIIE